MSLILSLTVALAVQAVPDPSPEVTAQMKELFAAGRTLYGQRRYAEAVAKFEVVYAIRPHPDVLFNVARCHEQLGATGKALSAYRAYLRLVPEAADRRAVKDSIANLERELRQKGVQQVTLFAEPEKARLEVDGQVLGGSPATVELKAGEHALRVSAEGHEPVSRTFEVRLAHASELTVTLARLPEPKPVEVLTAPPPPPLVEPLPTAASATVSPEAPAARRWWWLPAGVGVVGLGLGAWQLAAAEGARQQLVSSSFTPAQAQATRDAGLTSRTLGFVGVGVGAAAAVATVVLVLVGGPATPVPTVSLAPGSAVVGVAGRLPW
jgi:hypothetical protein